MPLWLQILLGIGSTFGFGSFALEVLRRRNAKRDRAAEGEATIVVKSIDDGAQQRTQLWQQMEVLRTRLERNEEKTDRIKATVMRLWRYSVQMRTAFDAAALMLKELGHEVPVKAPEPLSEEEVFGNE